MGRAPSHGVQGRRAALRLRLAVTAVWLVAALLAISAPGAAAAPTNARAAATGSTGSTGKGYQNPVSGSIADPQVLKVGHDYYLYSTGLNFPIERSTDLVHWTFDRLAFKRRPSWVLPTGDWHPWAPDVIRVNGPCPSGVPGVTGTHASGCYFMYYTGESAIFDTNCVAVATSPNPAGPFVDRGPLSNGTIDIDGRPIGCGDPTGWGNIDPDAFVDTTGQEYLYMSTAYICPVGSISCTGADATLSPTISVIQMAADHVGVTGARTALFAGTERWEDVNAHKTVEGPYMDLHGGVYHLFYSGGDYTKAYGMGVATLATPLGPAVQDPSNPILKGDGRVTSPGGGSTVIGPHGGEWMVYHARLGPYTAPRDLFISPVVWGAHGSVAIDGPTFTRQSEMP